MSLPEEQKNELILAIRKLLDASKKGQNSKPALEKFVAATSKLHLSNFSEWQTVLGRELFFHGPAERIISFLPSVKRTEKISPWLDMMNPNGYRREDALKAIEGPAPNAFLFAMLVRRLNDWVPQVRDAARQAVKRVASKTNPETLLDILWLFLPVLPVWGRLEPQHKGTLDEIVGMEGISIALKNRVIDARSGPAAAVLAYACRQPFMDAYLQDIARAAIQPAVRAKAYQFLLQNKAVWLEGRRWVWTDKKFCKGRFEAVLGHRSIEVASPILDIIGEASKDNSGVVRRVAASALLDQRKDLGEKTIPLAKVFSEDSYPSIAERGRFILDRIGH